MRVLTTDLYEAAYLKAKGMKIARVLKSKNSALLEFEGNADLDVLKNKYRERHAEINVHQLKNELRQIKDIVFTVMRDGQRKKSIFVLS